MKKILNNEEAQKKLDFLRENNLIILECIVGSQAYGTALPTSDIDKKFVYIDPLNDLLSNTNTEQLNINKDFVGYEVGRFCELLSTCNPNMLDLLDVPDDCIIIKTELFDEFFTNNAAKFLSKTIEQSFGRYAYSQIAKAHGANKKVMQPMDKHRKGLLDFCWISEGQGSVSLRDYLALKGLTLPSMVGVAAIDHMKNCYNLFSNQEYISGYLDWVNTHGKEDFPPETPFHAHREYKGVTDKNDVQIVLSSIKKGAKPLCTFYCNIEGFQKYCKDYREYWDWVENRNEERYKTNIEVGKGYDTKNMAHCHRLLNMCLEILETGKIRVRRTEEERKVLLQIRAGDMEFEDLISEAEKKIERVTELAALSTLPLEVDTKFIEDILFKIRNKAYNLRLTN